MKRRLRYWQSDRQRLAGCTAFYDTIAGIRRSGTDKVYEGHHCRTMGNRNRTCYNMINTILRRAHACLFRSSASCLAANRTDVQPLISNDHVAHWYHSNRSNAELFTRNDNCAMMPPTRLADSCPMRLQSFCRQNCLRRARCPSSVAQRTRDAPKDHTRGNRTVEAPCSCRFPCTPYAAIHHRYRIGSYRVYHL